MRRRQRVPTVTQPVKVNIVERDVRVKYKQAALGMAWAVIQPVVFIIVFTSHRGPPRHSQHRGVSYAAFALSSLGALRFYRPA